MHYTYEITWKDGKHVCTNFEEALTDFEQQPDCCIRIYDNLKDNKFVGVLKTMEDIELWREKLERDFAWVKEGSRWSPINTEPTVEAGTSIEKAVDAPHYKGYIDEYQWLDAMSRIPSLRKPELFCAALELQVRKYLDRKGGKDAPLQELKKARFYLEYMIQYMEGKNVSAASVHEKLKD